MKNIVILFAFYLISFEAAAVCTSPISRTNNGTGTVLTAAKLNADFNAVYNKVNNLPGDCVLDDSLNGSKLINATVTAGKLANDSVATANIQDGAITAAKLAAAIDSLVPKGTILPFGGATAPTGYLICNGQSISRTTYAGLYAVVGTSFGTADGNSFNVPDLRGKFLRMVDGGVAYDPDRASRTALKTGGAVGDNIGSYQGSQFTSHYHFMSTPGAGSPTVYPYIVSGNITGNYALTPQPSEFQTSNTGGNETRPVNVNVNYIIKY